MAEIIENISIGNSKLGSSGSKSRSRMIETMDFFIILSGVFVI